MLSLDDWNLMSNQLNLNKKSKKTGMGDIGPITDDRL